MNKQMLLIITGLPYSGKTTLIKEIVKRYDYPVVSVDEFLHKGNYIVENMTQDDWNRVYSQAFNKLKTLLSQDKNIIFDGGSLLKSERDALRNIAKEKHASYKLIYVKTPKEEIKRRWLKNQKIKTRGHVKEEILDKAFEMFEEPSTDEEFIIYEPKNLVDKWIEDNLF